MRRAQRKLPARHDVMVRMCGTFVNTENPIPIRDELDVPY